MDYPDREDAQAFSSFADAVYAHYVQKVKDAEDPFEAYSYQQRLDIFLFQDIYRSRIVRGYRVLLEHFKLKEPEE